MKQYLTFITPSGTCNTVRIRKNFEWICRYNKDGSAHLLVCSRHLNCDLEFYFENGRRLEEAMESFKAGNNINLSGFHLELLEKEYEEE